MENFDEYLEDVYMSFLPHPLKEIASRQKELMNLKRFVDATFEDGFLECPKVIKSMKKTGFDSNFIYMVEEHPRIIQKLKRLGYKSFIDFVGMTREQINKINGIGKESRRIIMSKIKKFGIPFTDNSMDAKLDIDMNLINLIRDVKDKSREYEQYNYEDIKLSACYEEGKISSRAYGAMSRYFCCYNKSDIGKVTIGEIIKNFGYNELINGTTEIRYFGEVSGKEIVDLVHSYGLRFYDDPCANESSETNELGGNNPQLKKENN